MHKILILGPQGSGKGTQAELLSERLGIPALSMGALLREEMASGSDLGKEIQSYVDAGQLVTDEMALDILKKRLEQGDAANGYILDGYPRNIAQYEVFSTFDQPTAVLLIEVPREESMKRLMKRAEIEGRADDTPELIEERLSIYETATMPVVDRYEADGILHRIDGVGSIEEIRDRIMDVTN